MSPFRTLKVFNIFMATLLIYTILVEYIS